LGQCCSPHPPDFTQQKLVWPSINVHIYWQFCTHGSEQANFGGELRSQLQKQTLRSLTETGVVAHVAIQDFSPKKALKHVSSAVSYNQLVNTFRLSVDGVVVT
jgi:hypothetical protein